MARSSGEERTGGGALTTTVPLDPPTLERAARAYTTDGYAVLSPAFGASDVAVWRRECERLAVAVDEADGADPRVTARARPEGGVARDRLDPVSDFSPTFRRFAGDPRLLALAGAVLGEKPVRFKDRLILKSAGTGGYGLHRDWPYWEFLGIPPDQFVSVMLSVDACDESNGAIEVFRGLHRAELPPAAAEPRDLDPTSVESIVPEVAGTGAGDVLLLHPMTPHRSGPNRSGGSRRILTYVFTVERNAGATSRYYDAFHSRVGR